MLLRKTFASSALCRLSKKGKEGLLVTLVIEWLALTHLDETSCLKNWSYSLYYFLQKMQIYFSRTHSYGAIAHICEGNSYYAILSKIAGGKFPWVAGMVPPRSRISHTPHKETIYQLRGLSNPTWDTPQQLPACPSRTLLLRVGCHRLRSRLGICKNISNNCGTWPEIP